MLKLVHFHKPVEVEILHGTDRDHRTFQEQKSRN